MSKLDDIFDQYRNDCFLAKDAGLDKAVNMLALSTVSHKQQIKDLMLELVGDDFHTKLTGIDEAWYRTEGENNLRRELRKKIEHI